MSLPRIVTSNSGFGFRVGGALRCRARAGTSPRRSLLDLSSVAHEVLHDVVLALRSVGAHVELDGLVELGVVVAADGREAHVGADEVGELLGVELAYPSGVCPRMVYYNEPSTAGDSPAALREKPSFTAVVTALARR